jgi:hypothetical protein
MAFKTSKRNFPPSFHYYLRCNSFERSNNSELQLIERGHRGLVNNVLNVTPQEEIKRHNIGWARKPRNWSITSNPSPMKMHVKKFSDNTSPMWGAHHLAGAPHLADDLPTGVTDTTVACPGTSSLSLLVSGLKIIGHGNPDSNLKSYCTIY